MVTLVLVITITILIVKRNFIYKTGNFIFYLEEKYYGDNNFLEIKNEELNELIDNKESFAIFIHKPFCSVSYEFNKILIEFLEKHKITFYKIDFSDIKKSYISNEIKYYPSFAIFYEGKLVDYLKADKDEDIKKYKNIESFEDWIKKYVTINKRSNNEEEKK